ncbi:TIGR03617 family F420-dependent LLM class oxidoreductase [Oceanicoccus sp. KOV_DT_Chl]|uniref:TIGR03617 family F420-dependent LLM class oxidoreductase n=1 Tax=Oceanicoccus sp. KOV_DT_Chl TaxID=1904639 RepID=UPI000C7B6241|nr:TIGR03617 family F420-dependent LLM class oxidoreductase [Oceanicoccus sp. KOV_DT_Chl]
MNRQPVKNLKVDGAIFPGTDNLHLYEGDLSIVPERARLLEKMGFDGVFTLDTNIDPFFNLLLAAEHTERLELITGVAVAFARSPMTLAQQAWNLHKYSQGRVILGLGTQVKAHIEKRFNMPWHGPAMQMREYVLALRAIWHSWQTGEPLKFRGEFYQHTLMTPVFSPGAISYPAPKIYVGALGPKMVEVAAEVGDGIYGHPFNTVKFIREMQLPSLRRGLEKSGKDFSDFDMPAMILTVTGRNKKEMSIAENAVKRLLAFYGSTPAYYPVLEAHGWGELGPRLNQMSKLGQWYEMAQLFSDEMMQAFCVIGAPEDIPDLVAQRCDGMVDRLTLYAPYPSADEIWPEIVRGIQSRPGKTLI